MCFFFVFFKEAILYFKYYVLIYLAGSRGSILLLKRITLVTLYQAPALTAADIT